MKLYEKYSKPTARLVELREGVQPTGSEIGELFRMYLQGCRECGVPGSIMDFGAWLLGNEYEGAKDWYVELPPAEVVW